MATSGKSFLFSSYEREMRANKRNSAEEWRGGDFPNLRREFFNFAGTYYSMGGFEIGYSVRYTGPETELVTARRDSTRERKTTRGARCPRLLPRVAADLWIVMARSRPA